MKILNGPVLVVMLAFAAQTGWADDITGHDRFLCSIGDVTMCNVDWECETDAPARFNIPDFIVFDLEAGLLKTTEASHENRQTPILSISREDGLIVLQGLEMGRAFSFNIDEVSGVLTASASKAGQFSGAFGVCTPIQGTAEADGK
ncbi:MAG: hypothetical protein P8127_03655 [Acidobacteriota bacterium]|jgi:hypothetical protein